MTDRLKHHLAADHKFDRLAELPRRCGGEHTMRPRPQLASKARAQEFGDDPDALLRQAELQIHLLTPRDGRWERDVRYQVARFEHCFSLRCAAGHEMKVADRDGA